MRVRRSRGDDGAVLVEFAILTPLLFLILFGIIEFGWAFYQELDVRHGAREGARLVAVNYNPTNTGNSVTQSQTIETEVCNRLDTTQAGAKPTVRIETVGSADVGGTARVTITKPLQTLTGYIDWALGGKTLSSSIEIRLEQKATWSSPATLTCS